MLRPAGRPRTTGPRPRMDSPSRCRHVSFHSWQRGRENERQKRRTKGQAEPLVLGGENHRRPPNVSDPAAQQFSLPRQPTKTRDNDRQRISLIPKNTLLDAQALPVRVVSFVFVDPLGAFTFSQEFDYGGSVKFKKLLAGIFCHVVTSKVHGATRRVQMKTSEDYNVIVLALAEEELPLVINRIDPKEIVRQFFEKHARAKMRQLVVRHKVPAEQAPATFLSKTRIRTPSVHDGNVNRGKHLRRCLILQNTHVLLKNQKIVQGGFGKEQSHPPDKFT